MTNDNTAPDYIWYFIDDAASYESVSEQPLADHTQYTRTDLANAQIAAVIEKAAGFCEEFVDYECTLAATEIRALATPDQQSALAEMLAEKERIAKKAGLEFAIEWFEDHHIRLPPNEATAIRAAIEKLED